MTRAAEFWRRYRSFIIGSLGIVFNVVYLLQDYVQHGSSVVEHLSDEAGRDPWLYIGALALIPLFVGIGVLLERIERERRRFETLFESASDGIYVRDLDNTIKFANSKFLEMHGMNLEEVVGKRSTEFLMLSRPERKHIAWMIRQAILRGEPPAMLEAPYRRPDGSQGFVQMNMAFLKEGRQVKEILAIVRDVSEKKRAEESLRASEQRYRALFEHNVAGVYCSTFDGRILDCNEAAAQIMGYASREELLTRTATDMYLTPADREATFLASLRVKGVLTNYELQVRRKDGSPVWISENAILTTSADGTPVIQGTIIDITERKHMEKVLLRRDAILKAVSFVAERLLRTTDWEQGIHEVVVRLGQGADVSRVYIFENHRNVAGELLTSQRYEWVAPGIAPQIDNPDLQNFPWEAAGFGRWVAVMSRGDFIQGHVREFPPSEREILAAQGIKSIVVFPVFVEQHWWGFIGFDECLTERQWHDAEIEALRTAADTIGAVMQRRIAEEALQRSQAELRVSEERYRDLIENANDGIYILDNKGRILSLNRKAKEITGYSLEEIRGELYTVLVSGAERQKARRAFLKNMRGEPDKNELTIKRKDGREVILELSTRPIWQDGQIVGIQGIGRDVTERKELEKLKSDFVSTVSHELRTPLTSIKGYVDLVLAGDTGPLTPEQKEFLAIVSQNTTRLTALINDLLEIERLESGRVEFEFAELALGEVLHEVARSLKVNAEQKGLKFLIEIGSGLVVRGDRERLAQVFINLLGNAIKYTPAGTVALKAYQENGTAVVAVRDTGIGLSENDLKKLFQKFFRSENPYVRKASGTGLGLSIARAITERHDGTITVVSQSGQGSTFTVRLPALTLPSISEQRPLVLIIEDEVTIARLIATYIERMGYRTAMAYSAREGLDQAVRLKPDLITLDVLMPDLDGFEVLKQLKKHSTTVNIPVIFLSIIQDRQHGLRLGASAFLTKPIDEYKFHETVHMLLEPHGQPVLVVDDDRDYAQLLQKLLQREGLLAEIAGDGEEALQKIQRRPYQLIVLDKNMPRRSGLEVLQELRSHKSLCHVPVIVVSGSEHAEELANTVQILGAKKFLSKKLAPQTIVREIVHFLKESD